ncbi:MAG TPA: hypothetical protein VN962_09565 [Polyangia bacterium]|nr:hypothetical protein [Polyangia bacterium]
MATTFEATVAEEAARLAALLDKNAPAPRAPVSLRDSDPPALRAFWRAVGWNARWPQRFRLHHPDVEQSARELPRLLAQLAEESPASPALKPAGLPSAFRIADVDRDGLGFVLTNEDQPERRDDPGLVLVIFETGRTSAVRIPYLNWCGDELIAVSLAGWFQELVAPSELPAAPGQTPFPTLSPTTRLLAPDVWLMPADAEARPGAPRLVAFANPADFARTIGRPPKGTGR